MYTAEIRGVKEVGLPIKGTIVNCIINKYGGICIKIHPFSDPNFLLHWSRISPTASTKPSKILALKGKRQVGTFTSLERGQNITIICSGGQYRGTPSNSRIIESFFLKHCDMFIFFVSIAAPK